MEPSKVQEIERFSQNNHYPDGFSSKERYHIKRRCENFTLKDSSDQEKVNKGEECIAVTEALELFGMDLIGKLTPTENGHQYICVILDYFTKWSEAYPLKTTNAEEKSDKNGWGKSFILAHTPECYSVCTKNRKQITTFPPYYLMFGREARYPCEVPKDYEICHGKVEAMVVTEQLSEGLSDRRGTMEAVKQNISKSQDKVQKRKMERGQEDNFVVGDKVLVRNV